MALVVLRDPAIRIVDSPSELVLTTGGFAAVPNARADYTISAPSNTSPRQLSFRVLSEFLGSQKLPCNMLQTTHQFSSSLWDR